MKRVMLCLMVVACVPSYVFAQGLHERIEARKKEASKPQPLAGGLRFQVSKSFDETFEKLVSWVNQQEYAIDSEQTRKEIGQVITQVAQKSGGYQQSGSRLRITLIKDDEKLTTLKVIVEDLKRKKLFAAEPWSDGKVNDDSTAAVVEKLKTAFGVSP